MGLNCFSLFFTFIILLYINFVNSQTSNYVWLSSNGCCQTSGYTFTNSTPFTLTRTTNNDNKESYVLMDYDGMSWNYTSTAAQTKEIYWQFVPKIISGGGIFFGMCAYNATDPINNCPPAKDTLLSVYFSGIAITYFGDNCYHIDHFVNNGYWTTPRHCLSEYELLNMVFTFHAIDYSKELQKANMFELDVWYDGFEYYTRENVYQKRDDTGVGLPNLNPCAYMFVPGMQLEYRPYSGPYPPTS